MPKFMDHHPKMPPMPPEAQEKGKQMLQEMTKAIKAKKADPFGVTPISVFMATNGESWCLTEAPGVDAVIKSHEANGMKLAKSDICEVSSLV
ncbi:MAG: hypothetical protein HY670_00845 [Chloroflexi bacterium]|nr:hypothetical protein [Chloroflexota bacterium]